MHTHQQLGQFEEKEKSFVQPVGTSPYTSSKKALYGAIGGVCILFVLAGVGTGYLLATSGSMRRVGTGSTISTDGGKTFGSTDTTTFTDSAIGTVEKDGISGEGTHKLVRDGGPSQTACLVSSVLDLDEFVGKKVKVQSKTMGAKKCPWLMDVGSIELQ